MSADGLAERTLLVTVDSLRYDHYSQMEQTRAFLGESHPRAFATSNATLYSFQSIIGGQYPGKPGLDAGTSLVSEFQAAGISTYGYQSNPLLAGKYGYADGFDKYDDIERSSGLKGRLEKLLDEGSVPYRVAAFAYNQFQRATSTVGSDPGRKYPCARDLIDAAIGDVEAEGHPEETDWFVWIHLMEPHHPYNPSPEFTDVSRAEAQVLSRKVLAGMATPEEEALARALYRDEVIETDAALATLWEWVPDDTRVVFCADHGELLGDDDMGWGHFAMFTPEILRVPLATRNAPDTTVNVVSLLDVPSLLLGREHGDGTFTRDIAFAANQGRTAATDGQTIVADDNTFHLSDEERGSETSRLERERARFEAKLDNLDLDGAVDMDHLRDLGYA